MQYYNGTINDSNTLDTLKVTGDTVLNGETYFVFKTNMPSNNTIWYRRINKGEVVSETDTLICPPDNSYSGVYNS